jgi:hypothetical protein
MVNRNYTDDQLADLNDKRGEELIANGFTPEWLAQIMWDDDGFTAEDRAFYENDAAMDLARAEYARQAIAAHPDHNDPIYFAGAMDKALEKYEAKSGPLGGS